MSTTSTAFEARVRAVPVKYPQLAATVIAKGVDWAGSINCFRDIARRLRLNCLPRDLADRLISVAGDQAQCEQWFPRPGFRWTHGP